MRANIAALVLPEHSVPRASMPSVQFVASSFLARLQNCSWQKHADLDSCCHAEVSKKRDSVGKMVFGSGPVQRFLPDISSADKRAVGAGLGFREL